ncbi:MAG: hypothetical protein WCC98_13850 [Candidatus Acidiferrales bacterium]
MDRLEAERFIRRRRTPHGYVIEVLNSRKFGVWKSAERSGENTRSLSGSDRANPPSDRAKSAPRPGENTRSRSDTAVDSADETAGKSGDASKPSSAFPPEPKIETDDRAPAATFIPPTSKMEKQKATAKSILLKSGYAEPLIELAFARALDINEAKRKAPPRSKEWFVVAAKHTLSDPEEREELENILANRTAAGIPASAPPERLEKPAVSKIAFVHAVVEEATHRGVRACDLLVERLA